MGSLSKISGIPLLCMLLLISTAFAGGTGIIGINYAVTQWGAQITSVTPGGPAEKAGIRVGDIITAVDRTSLAGATQQQMSSVIGGQAGTAAIFTVRNQRGQYQKAVARIARSQSTATQPKGLIGITYEANPFGARILKVTPNSGAAKAGILPGDIITKANNTSLAGMNSTQISAAISGAPGTPITFTISNRSGMFQRVVVRGAAAAAGTTSSGGIVGISYNVNQWGALVAKVTPGSPAQKAGINPGDVITAVNNTKLAGMNVTQMGNLIGGPVGSTVTLTVANRAGSSQKTLVRASSSSAQQPAASVQNGVIGINFAPNQWGMRITSVTPTSAAARAGITTSDTITAINGRKIAGLTVPQVQQMLFGPAGTRFVLTLGNQSGSRNIPVTKEQRR